MDFGNFAPLTLLTSMVRPFHWTTEAEAAFKSLKKLLSIATNLLHPDATWQFTVELDALNFGVGAVVSQMVTEQIYDIWDQASISY